MAKKDLVDLLVRMSGDPALQADFSKDPAATLDKFNLSDEERKLVMSGDESAIRAYLGDDSAKISIVTPSDGTQ